MLYRSTHSFILEKLRTTGRINLADDAFGWSNLDAAIFDRAKRIINDTLSRAGVLFENRSLSLMHLPFIFSENLKTNLEAKFARLHKIIERIPSLYLTSAAVRAFFRLPPMMDEFVRINGNVEPNVFLCRYDFSLTPSGSLRIYELNAAAPAALSFSPYFFQALTATDLLAQIKSQVPFAMQSFLTQRKQVFMSGIKDFMSEKYGENKIYQLNLLQNHSLSTHDSLCMAHELLFKILRYNSIAEDKLQSLKQISYIFLRGDHD